MTLNGRIFVHVDMDAFFISVEELANPALKGRPCAVAGPGKRSIITTSSYPARKTGVRTGMTVAQARCVCPGLTVIRADYRKYSDASGRVMDALGTFTPDLRVTSVDEAWFEGTFLLPESGLPRELGRAIKNKIGEDTGLTCSVGIGENRLLAKLASGMEKPDGLTVISPDEVSELMEKMPVERIGGIGPKTSQVLHGMGIRTCGQLGRYPVELLGGKFGARGVHLGDMARGLDPHRECPEGKDEVTKSVGHSVTLQADTVDRDFAGRVLLTLSEMVGRRARKHGFSGKRVTLTWRYSDMTTHTRQRTLPSSVNNTGEIYRTAMEIFSTIRLSRPVRLLGVSITREPGTISNGLLFPDCSPASPNGNQVQETLDRINNRYGEFTLTYADALPDFGELRVISPSWRRNGLRRSS
ncbi:MAG: DNA polymerase IV [bacterium]|nr:DNA polymerase IV [bacterium]MDT8396773.1 DNA polymerase IV [bacterium]